MRLQKQAERPRFIGIYEAAKYCGVSYRLFRKAVAEGRVPCVRFGTETFRFSREALDKWIMNGDTVKAD